jgi:hypothetical protein
MTRKDTREAPTRAHIRTNAPRTAVLLCGRLWASGQRLNTRWVALRQARHFHNIEFPNKVPSSPPPASRAHTERLICKSCTSFISMMTKRAS